MRIDLHCHSKFSKRPTLWIMQKIGCPESFTEPRAIYDTMTARGMGAVTITDHNVIDACLEIAHLPNTFISEEVTTYFPEDNCKVHVLVYDISEVQHREIQRLRRNIFEFVDYCHGQGIRHVLAHPFFGVNDRLTLSHVERLLLLFKYLEFNADQTAYCNDRLRLVADALTPAIMDDLIDKYGIVPHYPEAWRKVHTAGSDDHVGLHLGTAFTTVPGARTLRDFWAGFDAGRTETTTHGFSPATMAHNVYSIGYQYYWHLTGLDRLTNKDIFLKYLDRMLRKGPRENNGFVSRLTLRISKGMGRRIDTKARRQQKRGQQPTIMELVRREAHKMIREDAELMHLVIRGTRRARRPDDEWFAFVNEISNRVLLHFSNMLIDRLLRMQVLDIFNCIGSAAALYAVLAPYFVSYAIHAKVRRFSLDIVRRFDLDDPFQGSAADAVRVAHFIDVFEHGKGISSTAQRRLHYAAKSEKRYRVMTCTNEVEASIEGCVNFAPIGDHSFGPGKSQRFAIPPLLEVLRYVYVNDVTHLHAETPGPMGLAALAVARILRLPLSAQYHTGLAQFAERTTGDTYVEDLMWKYMMWFYEQMDVVYVPSRAAGEDLIEKGITPGKICVVPVGVDTELFHPSRRGSFYVDAYSMRPETVSIVYCGRVGRDHNLHLLAEAFRELHASGADASLVIIGDGPYRLEMQEVLKGLPATFILSLDKQTLAHAFASADMFVSPAVNDLIGTRVFEAMAAGVAAIAPEGSAAADVVVDGVNGRLIAADDGLALLDALVELVADRDALRVMGEQARAAMEPRSYEGGFDALWQMLCEEETPPSDAPIAEQLFLERIVSEVNENILG